MQLHLDKEEQEQGTTYHHEAHDTNPQRETPGPERKGMKPFSSCCGYINILKIYTKGWMDEMTGCLRFASR